MRDLHSNIEAVTHVAAQVISATNTPSSGVDRKGADAIEFLISVGAITNIANSPQPSFSFKLQESDSESSDFSDVTDANDFLVGSAKSPVTAPDSSSGVFLTIDDAAEDAATYRIGYVGSKRYVRVVATAANTPGDTPYSVVALLSRLHLAPAQDA